MGRELTSRNKTIRHVTWWCLLCRVCTKSRLYGPVKWLCRYRHILPCLTFHFTSPMQKSISTACLKAQYWSWETEEFQGPHCSASLAETMNYRLGKILSQRIYEENRQKPHIHTRARTHMHTPACPHCRKREKEKKEENYIPHIILSAHFPLKFQWDCSEPPLQRPLSALALICSI